MRSLETIEIDETDETAENWINETAENSGSYHLSPLAIPMKRHNTTVYYHRDDLVFEERIKEENRLIIKGIVKALRIMEEEAKNGFYNLSVEKQIETVKRRKSQVGIALSNGSFYPDKRAQVINKAGRLIENRYFPFMKKSAKLSFD